MTVGRGDRSTEVASGTFVEVAAVVDVESEDVAAAIGEFRDAIAVIEGSVRTLVHPDAVEVLVLVRLKGEFM